MPISLRPSAASAFSSFSRMSRSIQPEAAIGEIKDLFPIASISTIITKRSNTLVEALIVDLTAIPILGKINEFTAAVKEFCTLNYQ